MSVALDLLFLTQTYPRFPGDAAGPFIEELARALVAGGDRVTVLAPHAEGLPARWEAGGVEVATFRYAPERRERLGYGRTLEADERLRRGAALATPFYVVAARRALARLLRGRRFDLLHAHWIVPNGIVAAAAGGRAPLAIGLHGSDVFLAERKGVRRLVRWALGRTRLLTGCSPELVERVLALGPGFGGRSRVIPYGVDVATFSPAPRRRHLWRGRLGIPDEAPLVLGLGRMATKKGFKVLVETLPPLLAQVPDLHLVLAGGGDQLEELRAATAAWPHVHFPGAVPRDTLPDLYRAADVFVLPALHDPGGNVDGLPNVILEAMASGLPVVASGISGIPLAVVAGETGLLVAERDPAALAGALLRLLGDRELARRMGESGRRRALGELTWEVVAARYREGYLETLQSLKN